MLSITATSLQALSFVYSRYAREANSVYIATPKLFYSSTLYLSL